MFLNLLEKATIPPHLTSHLSWSWGSNGCAICSKMKIAYELSIPLATLLAYASRQMVGDEGPFLGTMFLDQFNDDFVLVIGPWSLKRAQAFRKKPRKNTTFGALDLLVAGVGIIVFGGFLGLKSEYFSKIKSKKRGLLLGSLCLLVVFCLCAKKMFNFF